jgi:hypothetical protein
MSTIRSDMGTIFTDISITGAITSRDITTAMVSDIDPIGATVVDMARCIMAEVDMLRTIRPMIGNGLTAGFASKDATFRSVTASDGATLTPPDFRERSPHG